MKYKNYWIGIIGCWILADAVASLYTYTDGEKAQGQSWWRDHSLRVVRGIAGIALMIMGTKNESL